MELRLTIAFQNIRKLLRPLGFQISELNPSGLHARYENLEK